MRRVGLVLAVLCAFGASARAQRRTTIVPNGPPTLAPAAPPPSNPAFLGITMQDHGNVGCEVVGVTRGSSAEDAGLRELDLIVAMDGVPTPRCALLQREIVAKLPGHVARFDVRRSTERIVVSATLTTRAEVLHRRLVGQPMEPLEVVDADDDETTYDLSDLRGKTTIVGWFLLDGCSGCSRVFDRVADGIAERLKGSDSAPRVLAVASRPVAKNVVALAPGRTGGPLLSLRKQFNFTSTVPLALTSRETIQELAIDDPLRIHFIVIDHRGVVRFVAPIAPGSDDIDAAIDEVLAAAEQVEHSRTQRR